MLMSLGLFVFSLKTAPFETVKRSTAQRWSSTNRHGILPATQYLGPGEDTITIDGKLAPELTGGTSNIDQLRKMAGEGKAWILTQGDGSILGQWFIQSVDETRKEYTKEGHPRIIEFNLKLKRYGEERPENLGKLKDSYSKQINK